MGDARVHGSGVLVAVVLAAAFGGCGGSSNDAALQQAKEQGRKEEQAQEQVRQQKAEIRSLQRSIHELSKKLGTPTTAAPSVPPPAAQPPSSSTSCGNGVYAGPNTSCPFATTVRDLYPGSSNSFAVFSPVTNQIYTMRCSTTSPHRCTGGNNASVYFP